MEAPEYFQVKLLDGYVLLFATNVLLVMAYKSAKKKDLIGEFTLGSYPCKNFFGIMHYWIYSNGFKNDAFHERIWKETIENDLNSKFFSNKFQLIRPYHQKNLHLIFSFFGIPYYLSPVFRCSAIKWMLNNGKIEVANHVNSIIPIWAFKFVSLQWFGWMEAMKSVDQQWRLIDTLSNTTIRFRCII